jgi:glutamine cyclotransferase
MIRVFKPVILNIYPHDSQAFTQGLLIDPFHNQLYESTGLYGHSTLRKVNLITGQSLNQKRLKTHFFGEGIAQIGTHIYQLTWKNQMGLIWNLNDLKLIGSFPYSGEGWGLTTDKHHLILSNGSSQLKFLDPLNYKIIKVLRVYFSSSHVSWNPALRLNALQWVKGKIYANLYPSNQIAIINPHSGLIEALLDLTSLNKSKLVTNEAVCNGIAYDQVNDRLYVTGKLWPYLYEIKRPL